MFSEHSLSISEGSSQPHVPEKNETYHTNALPWKGCMLCELPVIKPSAKKIEYFYVCMLKETL